MSKTLVAYFSASGVTAGAAKAVAQTLQADLYEITPKERYIDADLDWRNAESRSSVEMKNKTLRPEIVTTDARADRYDVILLGFPIWWYVAPTIVNTFLEQYDLSGKRIVLFATSGGSGFGKTAEELKVSVDKSAVIEEGMLQRGAQDLNAWKQWAQSLKL